ncbi:MAG TPA: ATP-binding protein [Thermoleophilia bacterium]
MHDVSLYLLELLENSVRAGASHINVGLRIDHASGELRLTVDDDGRGFDAAPERILDPFFTTKEGKKTGLGLSLLRAEAEAAAGGLTLGPSPTLGGARVDVAMRLDHVDRPPLGDLATTLVVTAVTNLDVEFTISLEGDEFGQPLIEAPLAQATELLIRSAERLA